MHRGKALISHLDSEERDRISASRDFKIPDWRTGDVLKISVAYSLSENNIKEWQGLCTYSKARNNIRATCKINFHLLGSNVEYGLPLYSPMLKNFQIAKLGSNMVRNKLNHIRDMNLSAGRLQEPIIKGRNFKPRVGTVKKEQ